VARKNVADAAKAKAEKQKKIVIGLGVVLALAMAYAVNTMMSMNKNNAASKPQVAADTTASVTPAPAAATPSALPAAPTLAGAATPATSATGALSTNLVNAVQPPADSGQLQSFSLFESKDPFHSSGPSSSGGGTSSGGSSGGGTTTKPPKTPPAPPTAPATSAVISVNGVSESVTSGGSFPAANPLFQLVSLSASVARVSVVGGSYANGSPTLTLRVNKPVTLANTADGTRYTLTLLPQGTVAAGAPSTASPSGSTTTTTTSGG
jgi:hypothetical protein